MIKIEKLEQFNVEGALRGMRNPLNSWNKSSPENDLNLAKRLYKAGTEHRKYLRQIFLSMDITAPLYWWKEFDTYKIGTTANSCSTMHKISSKYLTLEDFSCEHLTSLSLIELNRTITYINNCITDYRLNKCKATWWQIIQLLPSSYNQKRTITMSLENALNIVNQRSHHKLDEWIEFCNILKAQTFLNKIME